MAWTLFASLTSPKEPDLDTNLATLANLAVIPCAVTGVNTLALSPLAGDLPPVGAYKNNQMFVGRAGSGNTAAVTAQYLTLAQLNVYKDTTTGPAALTGAEFAQGQMLLLAYDGTLNSGLGGLHLLNPIVSGGGGGGTPGPPGPAGVSSGAPGFVSNLKVLVTSDTAATITYKAVGLSDQTATFLTSFNGTLTLATGTIGVNGRDSATALANQFYYLYVIYAPGTATTACLMSTSATAPTLPTGYTLYARVGTVLVDGSSRLVRTIQYNDRVQYIVDGTVLTCVADYGARRGRHLLGLSSDVCGGDSGRDLRAVDR